MKILVCHNKYKTPGGEDTVVDSEISNLKLHGNEVIEYIRNNNEINGYGLLRKVKLYYDTTWSKKSYLEIHRLCKEEKPDIAHFHNYLPLISPSAYYACKETGVPVIQTLHNYRLICPGGILFRESDICEECLHRNFSPSLKYRCYRRSYLQTMAIVRMLNTHRKMETFFKKVDMFISLTEFSKNKFIEAGIPGDKIIVKPNFLEYHGETKYDGKYAVYVGRLSIEKGAKEMVSAWKNISFPLKIIGEGPLRKELQMNAGDNVEFLGWLSRAHLFDVISKARFLLFPSIWYETFGLTMIESFACGIPVIASHLGTMKEIVNDGKSGLLFKSGDVADLALKANRLINDITFAKDLGREAMRVYESKYTAEANYSMLISIYRNVIQKAAICN